MQQRNARLRRFVFNVPAGALCSVRLWSGNSALSLQHVHTSEMLRQYLHSLSNALGVPGDDLHAMLEIVLHDFTEAVPSLLGLRISITVDDLSTTVNTVDPFLVHAVRTSLSLPLQQISSAEQVGSILLFAAAPGAFLALAAAARRLDPVDGQIVVDGHLPRADQLVVSQGITGTGAVPVVNMAIGVLIDRGFPTRQARRELARLAALQHNDLTAAANRLLASRWEPTG